jgi:aminoglycoside phosphotransferase (APT) family kinase protein
MAGRMADPRFSPPPPTALAWAAAAVGPAARVVRTRLLRGASSAAVHAVDILPSTTAAAPLELVLRRHVLDAWLAREPDLAAREADALSSLSASTIPAPRLVACDPDGSGAGAPAVLMTRLPGRVRIEPSPRGMKTLAALLPAIHAVQPSGIPASRRYEPYNVTADLRPPAAARDVRVWERAIDRYRDGPPPHESTFIHRDFHPGNVLWRGADVTGVVDWIECCAGPPAADVGHCRHNLADGASLDAADAFLAAWQAVAGVDSYDPWWDLVSIVDWLPPAGEPEWGSDAATVERIEAVLGRALAS